MPELREGTFLWVDLGQKDPYFILPILAAAFTFLSTWLTNKAAKDRSAMLLVMNIMLPIFIFWFGTQISSGGSTLLGSFERLPSCSDFGF